MVRFARNASKYEKNDIAIWPRIVWFGEYSLNFLEYRYFVRELSIEVYMTIIAIMFSALGIWIGLQFMKKRKQEADLADLEVDDSVIEELNISPREYEVLKLIAEGYSNQEIADRLFVTLSTVKTHSSSLFSKLDVKRRTQAIQKAKELKIVH